MAAVSGIKSVCLITPGHIASNPRLVKEAIALAATGIRVHIIFTQYVNYLVAHDQQILAANSTWTYDCLNWTTFNFIAKKNRLLSGIKQRLSTDIKINLNRNFHWQLKKAVVTKADLYIAHNPGALPVAVLAAKQIGAKSGFDAEDFHRHEVSDDVTHADVSIKTALENEFIPQVNYLTAASPMIAEKYQQLYDKPCTTMLNVLPKTTSKLVRQPINNTLQLFWFSQTIGPNRGIETTIEATAGAETPIHLHLLGHISDSYRNKLSNLAVRAPLLKITYHSPVHSDEIPSMAAMYDIGLAAEPGFCINNKIALSNKIFTYISCGLALVASTTDAQTAFIQQYPQTGKLYRNAAELTQILIHYHHNRHLLNQTKADNIQLGQTELNWENESKKFINIIQHL